MNNKYAFQYDAYQPLDARVSHHALLWQGVCYWGVSATSGRLSATWGGCLLLEGVCYGGCLVLGGVCYWGMFITWGVYAPGRLSTLGGVCSKGGVRGVYPGADTPLWEQNDRQV